MTIDEAIEYQEGILKTLPVTLAEREKKAIRLGIEALKRHRDKGILTWAGILEPLPGETE